MRFIPTDFVMGNNQQWLRNRNSVTLFVSGFTSLIPTMLEVRLACQGHWLCSSNKIEGE
jgi:hypothetical protein